MPAVPYSKADLSLSSLRELSPGQYAALSGVVAVAGLAMIRPALSALWNMWTTDALKSVGMLVPIVSAALILKVWRELKWEAEGSWWGFAILMATAAVSFAQRHAILLLVVSLHWTTPLPPPAFMLLAYGSGVVLLFGGARLYRATLFPILLLWFANPVPHAFSLLVDLPLQQLSAHIARAFAMHLGQPLTADKLRLMFTPQFGMFIAPGCNGIRGALTMALIALLAGYLYRFRWYATAAVVVGAVLLGYLFNLARLCLLVLYYLVALRYPSLQGKATNADYVIGATMFFSATLLLFAMIHWLRDRRRPRALSSNLESYPIAGAKSGRYSRLAAMMILTAVALFGLARSASGTTMTASTKRFPQRVGNYTLVRTWNETLVTGPVVYLWAQYAPAKGGTPIAVGVSPILGWHDPLLCHTVRGEHPVWQGPLLVTTGTTTPVSFSSALYDDGMTRSIEASTQCAHGECGESETNRTDFGFVYTPTSMLNQGDQQAIRVLVMAESQNETGPEDITRRELTEDVEKFLASVNLADLTLVDSR